MSASGLIVFRLFSGPHMGAELVLPAGNQLVGSDDSCDIILQDSSVASRHANIVIGFSGDGAPSVRVTPLDGEILLNGAPLPSDGADIPARTPFFLGLTGMVGARRAGGRMASGRVRLAGAAFGAGTPGTCGAAARRAGHGSR